MSTHRTFYKLTADGNDFIFADQIYPAIQLPTALPSKNEIIKYCDRNFGIGADGLVILSSSAIADVRWHFFNKDGERAEFCGNACRCLGKWMQQLKLAAKQFTLEIDSGEVVQIGILENAIQVQMPTAQNIQLHLSQQVYQQALKSTVPWPPEFTSLHFLEVGVPHLIVEVKHWNFDLPYWGRKLRSHPLLNKGANVNFVFWEQSQNILQIKTFERGVEDFTLSCGSGIAATALTWVQIQKTKFPVLTQTQGGQTTVAQYQLDSANSYLTLMGSAELVFKATWDVSSKLN